MVFVYTGKGKRGAQRNDAPPEQKHCAEQACSIQWCLAKRGHQEHRCQSFIDAWKECVEKARAEVTVYPNASNHDTRISNNEEMEEQGVDSKSPSSSR